MEVCASTGAKAFEWQQEIGLNQARRTGEVADVDALFKFAVLEAGDAEASSGHANGVPMAALTNEEAVRRLMENLVVCDFVPDEAGCHSHDPGCWVVAG